MKRQRVLMSTMILTGGLFLFAGGCQTRSEEQLGDLRFNPAPEMATLQQSEEQAENAAFQTFDHNWRAMRSDMGRLLLTDRPSRLGIEPIR
jgi:hypothetical protein